MGFLIKMRDWPVRYKVAAILAITVIPIIGVMLCYLGTLQQFVVVQAEVDRHYAVQLQTQAIMNQMSDVQDGFRGFVLTHNEKFLGPFFEAEKNFDPVLRRLKDLIRKEPDRQQQVAQIEADIRAFLQLKRRMIDAFGNGDLTSVREHIQSGTGTAALTKIQTALIYFEELERN